MKNRKYIYNTQICSLTPSPVMLFPVLATHEKLFKTKLLTFITISINHVTFKNHVIPYCKIPHKVLLSKLLIPLPYGDRVEAVKGDFGNHFSKKPLILKSCYSYFSENKYSCYFIC